ncbi:hypothetical protein LTR70_009218 [Exophiala xenobiotica]|uniref:Uncharacterized protein n=1 Tax=Lithohypha guttulata TaxID=1690604 RepID=A0ABR0KGR8_9EURO|nr:hypothetical protein LTR24_002717 [Lithohypha guttulata]KAK5310791.1 hypothetical protein LTR70_009218 [Exophiala xenobiotica]
MSASKSDRCVSKNKNDNEYKMERQKNSRWPSICMYSGRIMMWFARLVEQARVRVFGGFGGCCGGAFGVGLSGVLGLVAVVVAVGSVAAKQQLGLGTVGFVVALLGQDVVLGGGMGGMVGGGKFPPVLKLR